MKEMKFQISGLRKERNQGTCLMKKHEKERKCDRNVKRKMTYTTFI